MTKWLNTKWISSLLFLYQKQTQYLPRRMLHSSHVGRISIQICCSGCVTGLYLHLKSFLAQNTDLVKAHLIQNVSTIQRSRSTYCDSNMVNMFYRLQMNASSPNCGHFLSIFDTLPFPMGLECSIWHYVFLLHHMKCSSIGNFCPLRCISKVLKPSPKL